MIPELNKEYYYFDDGKIRFSRLDKVKITKIIPFDETSKAILSIWKKEKEDCDWLYKSTTDYFICGRLINSDTKVMFARTIDGGWFSLGWDAGRLDLHGDLIKMLNTNQKDA